MVTGTWRNVVHVERDIDLLGSLEINRRGSLGKRIGNGSSTSYWKDKRLGNFNLHEKLFGLFSLERDKDVVDLW